MGMDQLVAFVVASIVLIIVPGPDMALVTRQVVGYGRGAGFGTYAGLLTGGLVHATFATTGISAVLMTSATAYTVVKAIGAGYLLWLGLATIWSSLRQAPERGPSAEEQPSGPVAQRRSMPLRRAYLLGALSNLTNPKVAVFFLAFLPQFVSPGHNAAVQTALLALILIVLATIWWIGYILLLDRISAVIRRPIVQRMMERATGLVLVAVGVRLAAAHR